MHHILADCARRAVAAASDRTAIIGAHRVSALRDADHILVLRDGRVIEEGSHEELLDLDGEYARLARAQALEEEIEAMD